MKLLRRSSQRFFSKDQFSGFSHLNTKCKLDCPEDLFTHLSSLTKDHLVAWDVATGSGQAAKVLSKYYSTVIATDLIPNQINSTLSSESTNSLIFEHLPAELPKEVIESHKYLTYNNVDLITVAQALHWFNLEKFYDAVYKVLKTDGIIAAWSYQLPEVSSEIDKIMMEIYEKVLGEKYWKQLENGCLNLEFPFDKNVSLPPIQEIRKEWNLNDYWNYLNNCSDLQSALKVNKNPLEPYYEKISEIWGKEEVKTVKLPMKFLIGKLQFDKDISENMTIKDINRYLKRFSLFRASQSDSALITVGNLLNKISTHIEPLTDKDITDILEYLTEIKDLPINNERENLIMSLMKYIIGTRDEESIIKYIKHLNTIPINEKSLSSFINYSDKFITLTVKRSLENFAMPFFHNICNYLDAAPLDSLKNPQIIHLVAVLAKAGGINSRLANKTIYVNMKNASQEHWNDFSVISVFTKYSEIWRYIKSTLTPQFANKVASSTKSNFIKNIVDFFYCPHYNKEVHDKLKRYIDKYFESKILQYEDVEEIYNFVTDRFVDTHLEMKKKLAYHSIKLYSDLIEPKSVTQILDFLIFLSKVSVREFDAIGKLYADLGMNYFKFTDIDKITILECLGRRGMQNSEIFETICSEILANPEKYHKYFPQILNAIAEANYENEPWAEGIKNLIFDHVINSTNSLQKDHNSLKLLWALIKCDAPLNAIEIAAKLTPEEDMWKKSHLKRLACYYYFADKNIDFGKKEDFEMIKNKMKNDIEWCTRKSWTRYLVQELNKHDVTYSLFEEMDGFICPIAFPSLKTSIFITTNQNLTYEKNMLRGDFNMLERLKEKQGIRCLTIDGEWIKSDEGALLKEWLVSNSIISK